MMMMNDDDDASYDDEDVGLMFILCFILMLRGTRLRLWMQIPLTQTH